MSLGRVSTFFDIYFTRDLEQGLITEEGVQEIIDQFVICLLYTSPHHISGLGTDDHLIPVR